MCTETSFDGTGVEFESISETWFTARKEHRCDECSRCIQPGLRYRKNTGTTEGDFWSLKFCRRCANAMDWLLNRGHGWLQGSIVEDVKHCVAEELATSGSVK